MSGEKWSRFKNNVKEAFRIPDRNEPLALTPRQDELLNKIAMKIVEKRLSVPAVMTLESVKPVSFIGRYAMIYALPFVEAFANTGDYKLIMDLLEDTRGIEELLKRVEGCEAAMQTKKKLENNEKTEKLGKKLKKSEK